MSLKVVIWALLFLSLVFVCIKVVPLLIDDYEFTDGLQNIARMASVNRQTPDKLRQAILKEAQQDNIPIQDQDIKLTGTASNVEIEVDYSVTADLGVSQWTLNFHPSVTNAALF